MHNNNNNNNNNYPTVVDGTWSHLKERIADVPCWSCRRRRVRCDAIRPACVKCTRAGIQCLGYGPTKPLSWVGMPRRAKKSSRVRAETGKPRHNGATISQVSQTTEVSIHIVDEERFTTGCCSAISTLEHADTKCLMLKSPSDPLVVNYGLESLEYIQYYEQRCCMECSIYEENSVNPYRQFLSLIQFSPLVHHTIVSLAAHHRVRSATPLRWPRTLGSPSHDASEGVSLCDNGVPFQILTSTHYAAALFYHRLAIQNLRQALAAADHSDSVVISTLLLIWVELLESGYQSWRHHLCGMRGLMLSRTRSSYPDGNDDSALTSNKTWNFDEYLEEVYVILQTFGSTLSQEKMDLSEMFGEASLENILSRAEMRSWTGCPAELMQVLCSFNGLCANGSPADPLAPELKEHAEALFDRLDGFSCWDWSVTFPEANCVETRYHLACSYKAAIKIYGWRLLGSDFEPAEMEEVLKDAVFHLQMIDPDDSHFKGCLWPAFVVGAEASDPAHRLAATDILLHMYNLLHTRSIERGLHALERIWGWRESTEDQISWIVYLYEDGEELLLV